MAYGAKISEPMTVIKLRKISADVTRLEVIARYSRNNEPLVNRKWEAVIIMQKFFQRRRRLESYVFNDAKPLATAFTEPMR